MGVDVADNFVVYIIIGFLVVCAGIAIAGASRDCEARGGVLVRGLGDVPTCVAAPQPKPSH